ncbi:MULTISPECIES: radical SAM family heme chaperone HemW [unclassified Parafrankia]|uniref:radical SAM family heme chaperone HemW n=1 Tax=unclassified Parafrankia TaxID=2994368 RepID=UPI000DA5A481|nr:MULTISPECIES: radical SAM family heme chaperone HemW [unclassified Parafrankia]TCJ40153.1 coproporphyrinogen III oxidase [Parafrankia sp. BMG5.11]CAI7976841.1 Heme chaperone HemW [Frankia sp. Hr75.2]SQD96991.1 putative oxygen-independent coproporphyrinogen-III oxidase [Parafrankia sp. Ea1.12]
MPSKPLEGAPAPVDGALPDAALTEVGTRPFGVYVHVPYCAARCGYCDFNTYTPAELGAGGQGGAASFVDSVATEARLARSVLGERDLTVSTVFVGGGTPTLLPAADLAKVLRVLDDTFGLAGDAEVTTEANPESVDRETLEQLRASGYTRISFGMQSARPHVLAALDRRHTPGRVPEVVGWARSAGFRQLSLDLIYGAPGESESDWAASLDTVIELAPDHVSAYALTVEEGTKLSRRVRRGELLEPDDDLLADRYLQADEALAAAGLTNYEVSNWARDQSSWCRHNMGYWRGDDWWGLGPGAHSHVGGVRWWNVRHPTEYATRVGAGHSPAAGREVLDAQARRVERVMLGVRLVEGLGLDALGEQALDVAAELAADGLIVADVLAQGRVALTRRGRLLTDTVVRALLPD